MTATFIIRSVYKDRSVPDALRYADHDGSKKDRADALRWANHLANNFQRNPATDRVEITEGQR